MKPSIGRIVHYRTANFPENGSVIDRPAIIVAVHDDETVNLQVFWNRDVDNVEWKQKVRRAVSKETADVGERFWPPREP